MIYSYYVSNSQNIHSNPKHPSVISHQLSTIPPRPQSLISHSRSTEITPPKSIWSHLERINVKIIITPVSNYDFPNLNYLNPFPFRVGQSFGCFCTTKSFRRATIQLFPFSYLERLVGTNSVIDKGVGTGTRMQLIRYNLSQIRLEILIICDFVSSLSRSCLEVFYFYLSIRESSTSAD